jgi:hypothetical protein
MQIDGQKCDIVIPTSWSRQQPIFCIRVGVLELCISFGDLNLLIVIVSLLYRFNLSKQLR